MSNSKNNKITLDLFQLHKKEDKHPKSWILASGKNLRKEIDFLIKELSKKYKSYEIINKICSKININIFLTKNIKYIGFGKEIKNKRKTQKLYKTTFTKQTGTSGKDWNLIEENKHFPSCKKLNKIFKILDKPKFIKVKCSKNDLCFKKFYIISNSLLNKKQEIPLVAIKELFNLWVNQFKINKYKSIKRKVKLLESIDYFLINQHCSKKTKSLLYLNKSLAKIIGAFCADGSFCDTNMISWEEEHLSNMQALTKWIKNCFNKELTIEKSKRERNSWTIKFRSKIIARYLTTFFGFESKSKTYTTRMPKIIRNSSLDIQKAFALGALTFEGSVNNNSSVTFQVSSKKFRDDVGFILKKDGLTISSNKKPNKDNHWYFSSNTLTKESKGILSYFEKKTIKWQKLKEHIFGFENRVKNVEEAKVILKKYYCKNTKQNIIDIFSAIKELKQFNIYDIIKILNIPRSTLLKYLNTLIKLKILNKKYRKRKMLYNYNENLTEWRLPNLIYHKPNPLITSSLLNGFKSSNLCPQPKNKIGFLVT